MEIEELYGIFQKSAGVVTDSRKCEPDTMFFALRGASFDGNAYAAQALEKGCVCAVIDNAQYAVEGDSRYVLVEDVLTTLQQLARHHRRVLGTTILAITGTNGKTTTKELTSAVLKKKFNLLYTEGNLNNQIGVPLTLLRLRRDHDLAVVEMGASHLGDIKELVDIAEPNFGLITNVGRAHLQGFGSFEGVIRTKGELYDYIREHGGKIFINPHNEYLTAIAKDLEWVEYVDGDVVECNPFLRLEWIPRENIGMSARYNVQTQLVGAYNLDNALAAATVGHYFGVSDEDICKALTDYTPSNSRSQFVETSDNKLVVDAYNANPTSMALALRNFQQMQGDRKLCIIGDMGELGTDSESEHQRIVDLIAECGFTNVWLVGERFSLTSRSENYSHFANVDEVKAEISNNKPQGLLILIKGSNSTKLFQLPELL